MWACVLQFSAAGCCVLNIGGCFVDVFDLRTVFSPRKVSCSSVQVDTVLIADKCCL